MIIGPFYRNLLGFQQNLRKAFSRSLFKFWNKRRIFKHVPKVWRMFQLKLDKAFSKSFSVHPEVLSSTGLQNVTAQSWTCFYYHAGKASSKSLVELSAKVCRCFQVFMFSWSLQQTFVMFGKAWERFQQNFVGAYKYASTKAWSFHWKRFWVTFFVKVVQCMLI